MARNERHVTQNDDGTWGVVPSGKPSTSTHRTQSEAIGQARQDVGRTGGGEVVIHGRDGKIRDSDTVAPGNDPFPPRDRK